MHIERKITEQGRKEAQQIAAAVLQGKLTILEGARLLVRFAHTNAIEQEDDRRLIIAIESETDHLPIGEVRRLWSSDALREKDPEIARCEMLWKDPMLAACQRIAN